MKDLESRYDESQGTGVTNEMNKWHNGQTNLSVNGSKHLIRLSILQITK